MCQSPKFYSFILMLWFYWYGGHSDSGRNSLFNAKHLAYELPIHAIIDEYKNLYFVAHHKHIIYYWMQMTYFCSIHEREIVVVVRQFDG